MPIILKIYDDHRDLFHTNPGSSKIHQNWEGGLADHLADMFRLSYLEYDMLNSFLATRGESLPFALASAQVAIFAHDAEKVVFYGSKNDPRCAAYLPPPGLSTVGEKVFKENQKWRVIEDWKRNYGFDLTAEETNAVAYTHGEGDHYRNDRRVMNEMAAFIGNIDRTSARILYDSGKDLG